MSCTMSTSSDAAIDGPPTSRVGPGLSFMHLQQRQQQLRHP